MIEINSSSSPGSLPPLGSSSTLESRSGDTPEDVTEQTGPGSSFTPSNDSSMLDNLNGSVDAPEREDVDE